MALAEKHTNHNQYQETLNTRFSFLPSPLHSSLESLVFSGYDYRLDKPIIIKSNVDDDPVALEKIRAESLVTANTNNPYQIPVLDVVDFFYQGSRKYGLVLSYHKSPNNNLQFRLDNAQFTATHLPRNVLTASITQAFDYVRYLDQENLVHQDIKPSQFFVDLIRTKGNNEQYLFSAIDLGSSNKVQALVPQATQTSTPGYVAPEQVTRQGTNHYTNQYQLAELVFELVTCEKLFDPMDLENDMMTILRTKIRTDGFNSSDRRFAEIIDNKAILFHQRVQSQLGLSREEADQSVLSLNTALRKEPLNRHSSAQAFMTTLLPARLIPREFIFQN